MTWQEYELDRLDRYLMYLIEHFDLYLWSDLETRELYSGKVKSLN